MKSLGQIAFEAVATHIEALDPERASRFRWGDKSTIMREAWERAALAVIEENDYRRWAEMTNAKSAYPAEKKLARHIDMS